PRCTPLHMIVPLSVTGTVGSTFGGAAARAKTPAAQSPNMVAKRGAFGDFLYFAMPARCWETGLFLTSKGQPLHPTVLLLDPRRPGLSQSDQNTNDSVNGPCAHTHEFPIKTHACLHLTRTPKSGSALAFREGTVESFHGRPTRRIFPARDCHR